MTVPSLNPDLERIAGALAECRERFVLNVRAADQDAYVLDGAYPTFTGTIEACRAFIDLQYAKAAVMAMREPSRAVVAAMIGPMSLDSEYVTDDEAAVAALRAAVDAMLGETQP